MSEVLKQLSRKAAPKPMHVPTPGEVVAARQAAGLSQSECAEMVGLGTFQRWSEHERGVRPMDPARWELFLIKTGEHPLYKPARGVPVPRAAVNRERGEG